MDDTFDLRHRLLFHMPTHTCSIMPLHATNCPTSRRPCGHRMNIFVNSEFTRHLSSHPDAVEVKRAVQDTPQSPVTYILCQALICDLSPWCQLIHYVTERVAVTNRFLEKFGGYFSPSTLAQLPGKRASSGNKGSLGDSRVIDPRCVESHALWYSSSRAPIPSSFLDPAQNLNGHLTNEGLQDGGPGLQNRRQGAAAVERSALARLRADEALQERRRHNVGNFGATWLKPPGITKSLYQLREERREAEEHAEAMRREQLAQQLAEAEADGEGLMEGEGDVMDEAEDGAEDAGEAPVERDLDDEIPDADEGFGYDGATTTSEEDDSEDSDDTDGDGPGPGRVSIGSATQRTPDAHAAAQQRRELRQVVATEDRFLGMMSRGQAANNQEDDMYPGADDEVDDEEAAEMLQEDDLIHASYDNVGLDDGLDMDMDGDLDDDIPEAESGGYEHTDSDASLTSSDEDEDGPAETSFAQGHPSASSLFRSVNLRGQGQYGNPRASLDLSSVLSRDGSSLAGSSSPQVRRLP
ncbi:hypothetical protein PspLS_09053 [Pyricularia sp. CBS 133598]|nr:hypothetical protein PspLS_09053 [Pyricularia sp. CBS 133598]